MWAALVPIFLKYAAPLFEQFLGDKSKAADLAAQLQAKLLDAQNAELQADTQIALAQIGVNLADAQSADKFTRRARASAVYVCVAGLAYSFILQPFFAWFSLNVHGQPPPTLDVSTLLGLLGALLGLGTWHIANIIAQK